MSRSSSARASRRLGTRARRRDVWVGVPLIVLVIVILIGIGGGYALLVRGRVEVDAASSCPISGLTAVTAILFDRTDPINDKQKVFLRNKLDALQGGIQRYEEVDTYSLEDQGDQLVRPLLRLCDPGKGTDANPLTANPTLLQERWEKKFENPLREMLGVMREGGGAKTSAIFEAIQSVSLQSFQNPKVSPGSSKRLIIISDLLQFTKGLDLYHDALRYENFQQSAEARRLRTNLSGVSIEIFFIPRARPDRIKPLVGFWTHWLIDQGVNQDDFRIVWVEG